MPTLSLAKELIACRSITPEDAGAQVILIERLKKLGFDITPYEINGVTNFWARLGHAKPLFCFAGHTDVVPPGDETQWQSAPFTPTIRDGYLYGRGAADMKSAIAAMMTAVERFLIQHANHKGSIAFLITSDEEGKALFGTKAVLQQLVIEQQIPDWCLVGEASSEKILADTIKIGRRGSLTADLMIQGKQGHVAYPELALNPIHQAMPVLDEIANFVWEKNPIAPFPATSLQIVNLNSGIGTNNVIPGQLVAQFNLRFSPTFKADDIQAKIKHLLDKHKINYAINWSVSGEPFYTPPTHSFIQAIIKTIEKNRDFTPKLATNGGTSDGRFFAPLGCAVVELGPNNRSIHQIDECIEIEELNQLSHLYEKILENLLT